MDYGRNKIRLAIIPAIEQFYPEIKQTLYDNIMHWEDGNKIYQKQIDLLRKRLIVKTSYEIYISIKKIQNQIAAKTILFEMLTPFGFRKDQIASIMMSFDSISGKMFYSESYRLLKDRTHLIITDINLPIASQQLIMKQDTGASTASLQLKIQIINSNNFTIPMDDSISCLDCGKLKFPLLLRRWTKGDYFYPLGMNRKKKKISDFLIDSKVPINQKEQIFVVVSGDKIACIVGSRIDERFKVTAATKEVWMLRKA